jgi:hypothetical protein
LREINLSDQTTRTIRLSQLLGQDDIRGITRSDGDKFSCITDKSLWTFDPRTGRLTKVCDAPKGGRFWHIAYDPKTHTLFVTASGESSPLFMPKNARQLVSIYVRRHPHITSPVFTSDGEFFYAETGDLWSGKIESEEGRFSLSADRYAPLAYLETANTTPNGTGVSDIAVTRDAIYVQLFRMGGSGWGVLLQLPRAPKKTGNEAVSSMAEVAVKELARYKESLQGLKSLGEINRPAYLCASPDEWRVYYIDEADHKEYLITNGLTQELNLRTVDQTGPTATATSTGANASEPPNVMNTTASLTNDAASAFAEKEIQAISARDIDVLVSLSADYVDLLDKGVVSRDSVRKNIRRYFDRWPIIKWKMTGPINVELLGASKYRLVFTVAFDVANPATNRRAVGTAKETRVIAADSAGTAKLVSQREKIIHSRQVGNRE